MPGRPGHLGHGHHRFGCSGLAALLADHRGRLDGAPGDEPRAGPAGRSGRSPSNQRWRWASEVLEVDEVVERPGVLFGAISVELVRRGARVLAVEADPVWAEYLGELGRREGDSQLRVVHGDFFAGPLPDRPYRVIACPPFGSTTAIMGRLLDDVEQPLTRADFILQ